MSNTSNNERRVKASFIALDSYVQKNIPKPVETPQKESFTRWGLDNKYPDYLLGLYNRSATLRAAIDACVDYIVGDDVLFRNEPDKVVNLAGDTARDVTRWCAQDLKQTGGFALEVIRDLLGEIAEVYHIDVRFLRSNADNTAFWYSEKWGSNKKPVIMSAFMPGLEWSKLDEDARARAASSIFFYKETRTQTYPVPCYYASIPSCEIEANIDDFHLNSLENGFTSSAMITFLNGMPSDEEKAELERNVLEKDSGHQNAGRIILNFADDKEHAVQVDEFKVEDFGERYQALEKSARQKIFTAFRANPNLFGIPTESLGFSSEEYSEAFKLFNRTQIRPAQRAITDAFTKIYGETVLTIKPFTLEVETETNVN